MTTKEKANNAALRRAYVIDAANRIMALDDFKHFLVEIPRDVATEWASRSEVCNRLTRKNLEALIDFINKSSPKQSLGKGNPVTGTPCHVFKVGNEFSRIIYVCYTKIHCKMEEKDWMNFAMNTLTRAKSIGKPDDAIMESNTPQVLTLRFWWD